MTDSLTNVQPKLLYLETRNLDSVTTVREETRRWEA